MTKIHLEDFWVSLRRRLSRVRRSNREHDAFLRSLAYVPGPTEKPTGPNDFVICGSPRSGTTLAAAQLFQPPTVVTVMEPWDGLRLPPHVLFESIRRELESQQLRRGKLDVELLRAEGNVGWTEEGSAITVGPTDANTLVGIKWPTWWQYLDLLPDTKFVVCLRHPHEVVDSYERTGGRLREGSDHAVAFNADLNRQVRASSRRLAIRRVVLYETINRRILAHIDRPNVYALRYERWQTEPDVLLSEISSFLEADLRSWPAKVRPSAHSPLSADTVELIRVHAPVARELGYMT